MNIEFFEYVYFILLYVDIIVFYLFILNESVIIKFEFVFVGVYKNMNNFEI